MSHGLPVAGTPSGRRPRPRRVPAHRCPTLALAAAMALVALAAAAPAAGQEDTIQTRIRASQERLQQIRAERERLQEEMRSLEGRALDISSELENIERQVDASAQALQELDFQTAALAANVEDTRRELAQTRDRLRERIVVLNRRLRSIYERGPMHAIRVLLSAESFGDLLNRYKYLHLVAVHDRMLVEEITELEQRLSAQERTLEDDLAEIERLRDEKLSEFARLQNLELTRAQTLQGVRARVSQAEQQIRQLAEDERRLNELVEALERERLEAERRRAAAGLDGASATLTAESLGQLPWPVDGQLIYGFGPERRRNGVTLRRNGIGIAAEPGTPVHAVRGGTVVMARPMEGFGPGVVLSHGEGYYTLYLYMGAIRVQEGQDVATGDVLGTVGGAAEEGPHLYLQIHAPVEGQSPIPVDPLPWLRPKR